MRWFIILILIYGCSPQKRLARIIKKNPHLANQTTIVKRDTIKVPEIKEVEVFTVVHDTLRFDSLLQAYFEIKQLEGTSINTEPNIVIEERLRIVKEEIIKSIIPDTIFTITTERRFTHMDSVFTIETEIQIMLSDSGVVHTYNSPMVEIPYEQTIQSTQINIPTTGVSFYKDWWFWLFLITFLFFLAYLFKK